MSIASSAVSPRDHSPATVTSFGRDYLARLMDLGLYEGQRGDMALSTAVAPLVNALHHVLAGGEVQVQVTAPGSEVVVKELQRRLACATVESNALSLVNDDGFAP